MAIIKHIPVKNRYYSAAVEYLTCKFDEHTMKPLEDAKGRMIMRDNFLIEGINCKVDTFGAECIEVNRYYGKNNAARDVKAHQYIISFAPEDNITMQEAMDFGKQYVETVVLLSQQKPDDHIEVDLELDELDITSAETKATYREIQQYVMKQTGMMVSNLNIAQVRRKCGLDMRENYNLPKSENAKQPKCPEKKEKAIREAVKYYQMK